MLISLDALPADARLWAGAEAGRKPQATVVEVGALLVVVTVMAANVVRDLRENLRNLVGGRMTHYERLIDMAIAHALADLEEKARVQGYDGVIGVKIGHPNVVDGGVEVIVYGNGFRLVEPQG